MKAVFDAGALIALDRQDRGFISDLRVLQRHRIPVRVSSAVVGQVWRDGHRQVDLARALAGIGVEAVGVVDGKRIGELLAQSRSADVVDAHVALIAEPGDTVFTSEPEDIRALLDIRGVAASIHAV